MDKNVKQFYQAATFGPQSSKKPKPRIEKWTLKYGGVGVLGAIGVSYAICVLKRNELIRMSGYDKTKCTIVPHKS